MKEMKILEFGEAIRERRSSEVEKTPEFNLEKKDVLSESCLGLCVE